MRRSRQGKTLRVALRFVPPLLVLCLALPVLSGFLGTIGPALGYLPALNGKAVSLAIFEQFFAEPGILRSIGLSLASGLLATGLAFALTFLFVAAYAETVIFSRLQTFLAPLLSIPHASVAFGLACLLAPSGLVIRAFSPWATGWDRPPDLQILNDSLGLTMIMALVLKEIPFLFLMALSALPQIPVRRSRQLMAGLGFGPLSAFLIACGPLLYRQLRLPVLAVLAFSVSVADVAIILGPQLPAPLAVRITTWMADPDLHNRFIGSAGALVQIAILIVSVFIWRVGEAIAGTGLRLLALSGRRGRKDHGVRVLFLLTMGVCSAMVFASLFGLVLWSVAGLWPFPDFWPNSISLGSWTRLAPQMAPALVTTVTVALLSGLFSLVLVVLMLWAQTLNETEPMKHLVTGLIYLPLIVPQLSFVFGLQVLVLSLGLQPGLVILVLVHMIFVFPYIYLSLKDPWFSLDRRYDQLSLSFGASPWRTLWAIRLPLLVKPVLTALAVGLAVSIGLYLPTVLIGAGRLTTITTEAVALSSGGDRRVIGVYALVQALLPFAGFLIASLLPALIDPQRLKLENRVDQD
ncbi:MAG: hypothetical protein RIR97_1033 [Pseudomonadota bacterium]